MAKTGATRRHRRAKSGATHTTSKAALLLAKRFALLVSALKTNKVSGLMLSENLLAGYPKARVLTAAFCVGDNRVHFSYTFLTNE
jgi:hypothetical protein